MQGIRIFAKYVRISRCISSTSINSNITRESRFMKKMVQGTNKSKKKWHDTKVDFKKNINVNPINKPLSVHTVRRMTIRDKLFMEHITSLVSMGAVPDIVQEGIEITDVKITADFKYVNIYWIPSNNDIYSSVSEEVLEKYARIIRHELSQLRVIGFVPPIQFVENKKFLYQKEVERRLQMIKLDEDSEQVELVSSSASTEDREAIVDDNSVIDEFQLPVMRNDVLGLDYSRIMGRITASLSKSKAAAQRRVASDMNVNTDNAPSELVAEDFLTRTEQQEIFSEFLSKRQIEKKREYRSKRSLRYKQQLLNNYEDVDFDEENDDNNNVEYSDKFEDDT